MVLVQTLGATRPPFATCWAKNCPNSLRRSGNCWLGETDWELGLITRVKMRMNMFRMFADPWISSGSITTVPTSWPTRSRFDFFFFRYVYEDWHSWMFLFRQMGWHTWVYCLGIWTLQHPVLTPDDTYKISNQVKGRGAGVKIGCFFSSSRKHTQAYIQPSKCSHSFPITGATTCRAVDVVTQLWVGLSKGSRYTIANP